MANHRLYLALLVALSFLIASGSYLVFACFVLAKGDYLYEPNPCIAWTEFGLSCGLVFMSVTITSWLIYSRRASKIAP